MLLLSLLHSNSDYPYEEEEQDRHHSPYARLLVETNITMTGENTSKPIVIWEVVYTVVVLVLMFAALVTDRFGSDSVMLAALTAYMAAGIISVTEGLAGFSNQGLLTVLVLFVIAEGISKTGALDWYMTKLLGNRPNSVASAQLRLMAPIAVVSAFLNNTPLVAVMIPIVQKWARGIRVSVQQLLIPLSFASILGGTCTLIGTSTNLVVQGLLDEYFDGEVVIGLFELGAYGVPVAMAGIAYVLLASPFLLPGGGARNKANEDARAPTDEEDILLGARLTPWSPAAGRSVQRSGLRDTGGIFLVSVHRAATGHVHRAVSGEFVLNVGDVLYFTGLVEGFGEFCEEHGLEVITNEVETNLNNGPTRQSPSQHEAGETATTTVNNEVDAVPQLLDPSQRFLPPIVETEVPIEVGVTKESLLEADEAERLRNISIMADLIRGYTPPQAETPSNKPSNELSGRDPAKIVVTIEKDLVVVGINAHDRAGLLLDISKGLARLNLDLRHTEARVVRDRSISIWRCDMQTTDGTLPLPDLEEIWTVLSALLSEDSGIQAIKKRGLRVIRARVTKDSRLVHKTAAEVEFRKLYKAAIVAVQKGNTKMTGPLSTVRFGEGDTLILQASEDSALLRRPPEGFYNTKEGSTSRTTSVHSLVNLITGRLSSNNLQSDHSEAYSDSAAKRSTATDSAIANVDESDGLTSSGKGDAFFIPDDDDEQGGGDAVAVDAADLELAASLSNLAVEDEIAVWKDLQVLFRANEDEDDEGNFGVSREFLTAMQVAPKAQLIGRNVRQIGIQKLPDLFLCSIERPVESREQTRLQRMGSPIGADARSHGTPSEFDGASTVTENKIFTTIDPDEPLQEGDVLWFSGPASAVGDLRKIPGLESYENEEVKKMNEKVHDRRLVQAVISRKGPLVGKTVKETRFRTRYGAAVIAVHREGKRVHEHPGNVKLQAGDVLLLEAGPSFLAKTGQNDRSFALLAEVEDSAPPRLWMLIPALIITVAMLAVYVAGVTTLLVSSLVAAIIMVTIGILTEQEARDSINWEVYITIAAAFGIGTALVNSGVAGAIANFLVTIGTGIGLGDAGLYGAVYFATFLISNVVTNNAAAALIFPIAMDAALQTGTDIVLMSFALMLGASASFMSPFGYTTNLLIYGPGGYKYTDFLYFGTPMQLVLWILSTAFLVIQPFYLSWIAMVIVLLVVVAVTTCGSSVAKLVRCGKSSGQTYEEKAANGDASPTTSHDSQS